MKKTNKQCSFCGKNFDFNSYPSSEKSGHKGRFCSQKCHIDSMKSKAFRFLCCICDTEVFTQPAQIKYRSRKTCSRACRSVLLRKRAEDRRVALGYTKHQLDRLARYSPEAERWRKAVFKRDDFTCQVCGLRGAYLEADHILPWAYFSDLRFELTNGRTLCRPCHDKTKISAKKMKEIYGNKNN